MKAILLSAGLGSRFRPHTNRYSKLAIPFLNVPIAGWPLSLLEKIGVSDVVVNTHHQASLVKETIQNLKTKIPNFYFHYESQLLGGAGSIKKNESYFQDDSFIYLNGDSVFFSSDFFSDLKKQHDSKNAWITFLVKKTNHPKEVNLWADIHGQLHSVSHPPKDPTNYESYFSQGLPYSIQSVCLI